MIVICTALICLTVLILAGVVSGRAATGLVFLILAAAVLAAV